MAGLAIFVAGVAHPEQPGPAKSTPSGSPIFTQRFDGPLVVLATNVGSRRWTCDASWLEGYDDVGKLTTRTMWAHFYVHPHARAELAVERAPAARDPYKVLGAAKIDCR
jgi:hypothetical protein